MTFYENIKKYWLLLFHPQTPRIVKVAALVAILYVLCPVDFIPDWFIGPGFIDDVVVAGFLVNFVVKQLRGQDDEEDQ